MKADPPPGRRSVRAGTLLGYFTLLRLLISWMTAEGCRRFIDLDRADSERFLADIASRPGTRSGKPITPESLRSYCNLLVVLYQQGRKYPELTIPDPFPGGSLPASPRDGRGSWPYTPDEIAVPLVAAALRLIGAPADDVIALQAQAQTAYDDTLARGISQTKAGFAVVEAIAGFVFSTLPGETAPWHAAPVNSTKQVRNLVDRIYDACFVVIAYLTGARVSEILGLEARCIEHRPSADDSEDFTYMVGRIYKTAPTREGSRHRWIAPPPVQRAIAVLEQLSEILRRRDERQNLWLAMGSSGLVGPSPRIGILGVAAVNRRLNHALAPFIDLPSYRGKPWHLHTHQGRKTFARFVGKRDRTGLHALKTHFGHVSRVMTDQGYVGTDFDLDELVDQQTMHETRSVLEELLTAQVLGGKTGRRITTRSQFRGRTHDGDLNAYIDFLMNDTNLRLGVCDWGYCVYRAETSACHGDDSGPNPVYRTQSTCLGCANFAVTPRHRPVWEARRARNVELLDQHALDPASRALAETRIAECDSVLAELDGQGQDDDDR